MLAEAQTESWVLPLKPVTPASLCGTEAAFGLEAHQLSFIKVSEEYRKSEREEQLASLQLTADMKQEGQRT